MAMGSTTTTGRGRATSGRASSLGSEWRMEMLTKLQRRNREQCQCFQELVHLHNHLFENSDGLRTQNLQLTIQTEKLREEIFQLKMKSDSGTVGNGRSNERTLALEQKLFRLQEELTEMHRRKGENAQQLIDIRNSLQEKEKELSNKEIRINQMETNIRAALETMKTLENKNGEMETTIVMLRDEHQALQLAYTSLEKQHHDVLEENQRLLQRWLTQKARDADKLNDENDEILRRRQAKLQKELADAAKEPMPNLIEGSDERSFSAPNLSMKVTLPTGVLIKFDAHDGEVNSIKWAPEGHVVATGGADRRVKLWEIVKGACELRGTLSGSNAAVMSVDFDTEGTMVLGASNDFATRVWTLSDQRLRHTLTGHSNKVLAAKFLGESSKVVSGSHDRTLKIWDLRSRACIRTLFAASSCYDLVTDRTASTIISGHFDKRIRFWDVRSESTPNEVLMQGKITSLDISSDGYSLLCCARDDTLKVLDLRMNHVVATFASDGFKVGADYTRAVFSPDGQYVTVGAHDGSIFIWSVMETKLEKVLKDHTVAVPACAWQPSGASLVSCDRSRKVVVWTDC